MALVIGTILSFLFLDPPLRYVVIALLALWEILETWIFFRVRKLPPRAGKQALIGRRGRVLSASAGENQVRVDGRVFAATGPEELREGEEIVVTAVEGLKLKVRPAVRADEKMPGTGRDAAAG